MKTISLGLLLDRGIDATTFISWIRNLRAHPWPGPTHEARRMYPVQGRNIVIRKFLEEEDPSPFLLFWDSDNFPPEQLGDGRPFLKYVDELAERNEPVIGFLYYRRDVPHDPVAYRFPEGKPPAPLDVNDMLPKLRVRGTYEVDAVGTGTMLIRRDVITHLKQHKAPKAIFETPQLTYDMQPNAEGLNWTEDMYFCRETRDLGYKVWLDTAGECAHIAEIPINSRHYLPAHGVMGGNRAQQTPAEAARSRIIIPR